MSADNAKSGKRLRTRLLLIATYLISFISLVWVLRGSDLPRIKSEFERMDWKWVALAIVSDVAVYLWHAYRWQLVLRPVVEASYWDSVRAIYIGLFANEVLPLRSGELIRCFLLGRWAELPMSVSLASALIERIFDGFWLVIFLMITLEKVPALNKFLYAGLALSILVMLCGGLLFAAMFFKDQAKEFFARHPLLVKLNVLLEDLSLIGHSRYLYYAALASVPYLLIQIIPIYAIAIAYPGFDLTIGQAAGMMVILRLGAVVPQAPGNLGLFQVLAIQALTIFGVGVKTAHRFSFVLWAVVTLPLLIGGFVALALTGLDVKHIRHQAQHAMRNRTDASAGSNI